MSRVKGPFDPLNSPEFKRSAKVISSYLGTSAKVTTKVTIVVTKDGDGFKGVVSIGGFGGVSKTYRSKTLDELVGPDALLGSLKKAFKTEKKD